MFKSTLSTVIPLLMLAKVAFSECSNHSFTSCADGIVHWYDPATGEICDPLDCGGGRAPPKTNVPGCAGYKGPPVERTASYLPCWTPLVSETPTITTESYPEPTADPVSSAEPTTTESDAATVETTSIAASTTSAIASTQVTSGISTAPSTTQPARLPTTVQTISNDTISATGTASTNGTVSLPKPTVIINAGSFLGGSLMAVAGAAIGVIVLL